MSELEIIKAITFYGFAFLILIFVVLSIFANKILYSLLYAVMAFFCTGGIFFSLGADYNAVVQIAIYGVAVPVIILFAIMFTSRKENKIVYLSFAPRFFIGFISIAMLFMLLWYSVKLAINMNPSSTKLFFMKLSSTGGYDSVFSVANGMYINYSLALFLLALTVMTVIVGISVLNVIKERRHVK